jgi:hypothetical protein
MSKRQWLMLFGIWVMVFLFLGFPDDWNKIIALVTGFFIFVGAYRVGDMSSDLQRERQVPYVEHRGDKHDITNSNLPS